MGFVLVCIFAFSYSLRTELAGAEMKYALR